MKVGESVAIDMFFDEKTTKFKLKFIGREDIRTKFGFVSTMIFRPLVLSGRIFKEEESNSCFKVFQSPNISRNLSWIFGFSIESFEKAKKTLPIFHERYSKARANFWNQLDELLTGNETQWNDTGISRIKLPVYMYSSIKHKVTLFGGVVKQQGLITAFRVIKKFIRPS
jgi:hypothetical protein